MCKFRLSPNRWCWIGTVSRGGTGFALLLLYDLAMMATEAILSAVKYTTNLLELHRDADSVRRENTWRTRSTTVPCCDCRSRSRSRSNECCVPENRRNQFRAEQSRAASPLDLLSGLLARAFARIIHQCAGCVLVLGARGRGGGVEPWLCAVAACLLLSFCGPGRAVSCLIFSGGRSRSRAEGQNILCKSPGDSVRMWRFDSAVVEMMAKRHPSQCFVLLGFAWHGMAWQ